MYGTVNTPQAEIVYFLLLSYSMNTKSASEIITL